MQARSCILVASSPEILCRVDQQREVTNRPLAGTRRRGETEKEDSDLEEELLADEKERAEHIMLVDLGRNDVGRVAEAGSVNVEKLMEIERYSHVMHISSTVKGELLSAPLTLCKRLQVWIGRESFSFVAAVIVDASFGEEGGFLS
jgi:anthranilate synthase component I